MNSPLLRTALIVLALATGSAHASLIQNGSFEEIGDATAIGNYGSPTTWHQAVVIDHFNGDLGPVNFNSTIRHIVFVIGTKLHSPSVVLKIDAACVRRPVHLDIKEVQEVDILACRLNSRSGNSVEVIDRGDSSPTINFDGSVFHEYRIVVDDKNARLGNDAIDWKNLRAAEREKREESLVSTNGPVERI
ncbi:MAG: hypothetical protein AAGE43_11205, partial [Pseudomonadota bacterium]